MSAEAGELERAATADAAHDAGTALSAFLLEHGDKLPAGPAVDKFKADVLATLRRLDIIAHTYSAVEK